VTWAILSAPHPSLADDEKAAISFSRDIKPVLADNCFGCHQPARDRGGYIMTDFEQLLEGGDSGDPAVVPGKSQESYLLEMIEHDGKAKAAMPPNAPPLTTDEVELIKNWIEAGAVNDSPQTAPRFNAANPPTYSRLPIVASIDFSPDGTQMAVSGFHEVLLIDLTKIDIQPKGEEKVELERSTANVVHRLIGISPRIASVCFSPDGKRLAVSGGSPGEMGEIQVWNVESGKLALSKVVSYDTVSGVSWSPDGSKIAFGCTDTTLRAIDSKTGQQVLFQGAHDDWIRDTVFSPDGKQLVSVGRDMSCKLVDVETQRFVDNITSITPGVLKGGINAVASHPTRAEVVIGGADGIPKVYRMNRLTKRVIGDDANLVRRMPQMPGRIQSVDVSRDATRIAVGSSLDGAGHIHVYSYEFDASLSDDIKAIMAKVVSGRSADEKKKVEEYVTRNVKRISTANIDAGIYTVKFHPNGSTVAAAGSDGIIRLIDTQTGKVLHEVQPIAIAKTEIADRNSSKRYLFQSQAQQAQPTIEPSSQIQSLSVWPESIQFHSPNQYTQLVVQANLADGSTLDVTSQVRISNQGSSAVSINGSLIQPNADGDAKLKIELKGQTQEVPVSVKVNSNWRPDFVQDVNPILTKVGCNAGTCHGSQDGKKGFKLSLRGYDPIYDIRSFTDDMASRRTNLASPHDSLMLMKPTGRVAHEGGKLIDPDSKYYRIIHDWIEGGAKLELSTAKVTSLEVFPKNPVLPSANQRQQMRVVATYADGSTRDVTREAVIETGDLEIAAIDGSVVTALRRGEAPLLARYEGAFTATTMTCMGDRKGFVWKQPVIWTEVDKLVANKWERMKILPSGLCTDEEFIRRIYLDLTGLPPTAAATLAFVADAGDPQAKRDALIDSLVGNQDFIENWSNKWADLLQVNRKYLGVEGAKSFRSWIRNEVQSNTPYDQFVKKILTAKGSNRENAPAAYYKIHRTPEDTMENTTHLFLATRFNCNKCHDHPFERWTQDQYYETAAYFAQVERKKDPESGDRRIGGTAVEGAKPLFEIIEDATTGDVKHDRTGAITDPQFPFVCDYPETDTSTRREELAAWITSSNNPYFATSYVNRLWGYMVGVGLIEPLDDIRAGNPATNPKLLEYLRSEFVESGFDTRHVLKLICKSRVYQLSIKTNAYNEDDRINYSHALARRLPAEVLFDAIHAATGSKLKIPGVPEGTRAAALPDAGAKLPSGFLSTLGRPARESACECERSSDLQLGSVLALVSGPDVAKAINDPANTIAELVKTKAGDEELIDAIFLQILNRNATKPEVDATRQVFADIKTDHQKLIAARDARKKVVDAARPKQEQQRLTAIESVRKELESTVQAISPDLLAQEAEQKKRMELAQAKLNDYQSSAGGIEAWKKKQLRDVQWQPLQVNEFVSESKKPFSIRADRAVLVQPQLGPDLYTLTAQTKLTGITAFRLELLPDDSLSSKGPGLATNGNLVLNEIQVEIAHPDRPDQWQAVEIASAIANIEQQGYPVTNTIDGKWDGSQGWAISNAIGKISWASFQLKLPVGYSRGSLLRFKLHQRFDDQHQLGCFRISLTDYETPIGLGLSENLTNLLVQPEKIVEPVKAQIAEAFTKSDARLAGLKANLAEQSKPVPVDAKIVGLREKLTRVSKPLPDDVALTQLNRDLEQSEIQLSNERLTAAQDLVWALINSPSFLFNR
jgi:WD40 repeat protein